MSKKNIETRRIRMHENLLFDVITKQAGTVQKAILEGVMNAIDAGASHCDVNLDCGRFSISDDGKGFVGMDEIDAFFETFGTPHEEGDARYGRFRMGRGQIMAFGVNTWRSNGFEMNVDIKHRGLDYDLVQLPAKDVRKGTSVNVVLYDKLLPSDLERAKAEIRRFVAWAEIPVKLNGECVSKQPKDEKWDFEDENAWYKFSERQTLDIYNLGVLVTTAYSGRFGTGGTVVSKHRLDVNFARNDVQSSCPVFKKIARVLQARSNEGARKKVRITVGEQESLARQLMAGDLPDDETSDIKVLNDITGRAWPLHRLTTLEYNFSGCIAFGKRGDMVLEMAMKQRLCLALDEDILQRFGVGSPQDFVDSLTSVCIARSKKRGADHRFKLMAAILSRAKVAGREYFAGIFSASFIPVAEKELRKDEIMLLRAVSAGVCAMDGVFETSDCLGLAGISFNWRKRRQLCVGSSDIAAAWTDGERKIWIERRELNCLRKGIRGAYRLALLMLHEYLHDGPDTGTHVHDQAFYEAFHEISQHKADPVGAAADAMMKKLAQLIRASGKALPRAVLVGEDIEATLAE